MQIKYTTDAFETLVQLINFIEVKNTAGAGLRWLEKYEQYLRKSFENAERKRICNNSTFKKLNLRCINFNDWLIASSIHENFVLIERCCINQESQIKTVSERLAMFSDLDCLESAVTKRSPFFCRQTPLCYFYIMEKKLFLLDAMFDTYALTERHIDFAAYKAQRQEAPEDLLAAFRDIKNII